MGQVKQGDTVRVHYTGKLGDGEVFDSSREAQPLQFTVGASQVINGFEEAVVGMSPGDSKSTTIPADDAYGQRRDDMVAQIERERIPEGIAPEIGQWLQLRLEGGQMLQAIITEMSESSLTVDANHPLAGKDLVFEIELVEIV